MATYQNPAEDEEKQQAQAAPKPQVGQNSTGAGGASGGSAGSPVAASGGPAGSGGGIQSQGQGTGFVNLENVLSANNAQGVVDPLMNKAKSLTGTANDSIATAEGQFNKDLGNSFYGAGYNGPSSLYADPNAAQDLSRAQYDIGNATNYAKSLGSNSGIASNLQGIYGNTNGAAYGAGAQGLDSFLAGAGGNGQLQSYSKNFGNLSSALESAQQNSIGQVAAKETPASNVSYSNGPPPATPPQAGAPGGVPLPGAPKNNPRTPTKNSRLDYMGY